LKLLTVILCSLALVACSEDEAVVAAKKAKNDAEVAARRAADAAIFEARNNEYEIKKAVLAILKDPDSAKFGEFTQINEVRACMTVNAKNSMGGYVGDQQAFLRKEGGKWMGYILEGATHDWCVRFNAS
jgi:hypothetical protein